jgi:phenylpropionate dioxygenase-like ring-hydroxylating dioxygenase large terminal subunit
MGMSGRFPFPIALGWAAVAYADEVLPGTIRSVKYFDRQFVLYRSVGGTANVVDAFCPHLGADLSQGTVEGENIACPFHGWRFDLTGNVARIPYCAEIPRSAKRDVPLRAYPTRERNGMIYLWYHPHDAPPAWDLEEAPEVGDCDWAESRRVEWVVQTIPQELFENVADPIHFYFVHRTQSLPIAEISYTGIDFHMRQVADMKTPRGVVQGAIEVRARGPFSGWTRFSGICDTLLMSFATPLDTERTHVRWVFRKKRVNGQIPTGGVADAIIADIVKQFDEDIPIWERKTFLKKPLLCANDGPIGQFRRWYSQFYASP